MTLRIAMWSGPRNISTAMMRAWEARGDCAVTDEPLYAHYLHHTRIPHPGFDDIIKSQSTSWQEVTTELTGPPPDEKPLWYQKHMTHHLPAHLDREWMGSVRHCFLIRSPGAVLASYARAREEVTLEDLGFEQQAEIFRYVSEQLGQTPPVLDSRDILTSPHSMLSQLCAALDIPFANSMLSWEPGLRETDGVWAGHWYASVMSSTGFKPYVHREPEYPTGYEPIVAGATPYYELLHSQRIRPQAT